MEKTENNSPEQHLKKSTDRYFEEDAFFILAVSGGPDSMALLYLFHKIGLKALVVHVNYGKRGKDSDLDQELVEQLAFQWNFECCSVKLNPKEAEGENFQNWARNERYRIFRDLKEAHRADAIVTAHHRDDQIETILQKIFRGSSPVAWQGMKEREDDLFRPLLNFPKQEILDFCKAESVPYRTDESNLESDYARNFIRHEFYNKLDEFFPGWSQNILALREQGEMFKESIDFISGRVVDGNKINLSEYTQLPEALKSAVIKNILEGFDDSNTYSKRQLQELAKLDKLQTGKSLEAGTIIITRNRDEMMIRKKAKADPVTLKITEEDAVNGFSGGNIFVIKYKDKIAEPALILDFEKLSWPLLLRNWKKGDSFNPLGMSGSQKISDHLTNRQIPAHLKEKALVLCGSDGTIYAIIYPEPAQNLEKGAIAELAKCESTTKIFLSIIIN